MLTLMGNPRGDYDDECREVTNPQLRALIVHEDVGPFRARGLAPAVEALRAILADVVGSEPRVHAGLGTAGMLCARLVRGSATAISNHSWGSAIDLTLEGQLDGFADGGTQFGLLILAEYFNDEGWYWGAVYNREDSMHFEVGEETLRKWVAEGKL
jgi:hypothetical protein